MIIALLFAHSLPLQDDEDPAPFLYGNPAMPLEPRPEALISRRRLESDTCQPAGDAKNHEEGVWEAFNRTTMAPDICQPGHYFECRSSPCCWGQCEFVDINRYFRCYRKKVCVDPGCACKCGPCWNSHEDCDPSNDVSGCDPPNDYPKRFAGCCCESCECEWGQSSSRVDGCCSCKECPNMFLSDGGDMQCYWDSPAIGTAPATTTFFFSSILAVVLIMP